MHATLGDPTFYQQPGSDIPAALARRDTLTRELEASYARGKPWRLRRRQRDDGECSECSLTSEGDDGVSTNSDNVLMGRE